MEGPLQLSPGQVIQGQTLVEKLGEGGFGEVWKASYYGQDVAVKFFHRRDRLEGSRRESIAQYVLGRLKPEDGGRFFPRVEHFDLDAIPSYMRMEFIEAKSLNHHFTKQAPFELGRALRIAEDLLSALVVVHDMGFVHGDLSASNVLVYADDRVKLIDVGYGVLFQESVDPASWPGHVARSTAMTLGVSVGAATPLYSAPERFTEEFLAPGVGKRADVFSFGKLLYQILSWESPSTVKPISRKVAALGAAWDDFVFKCVSERPQDRFADAREALAALQDLAIIVEAEPSADRTDTKVRKSLGKFRSLVEIALADRVLTQAEMDYLREKAAQMGIPQDEAGRIIQEMTPPPPAPVIAPPVWTPPPPIVPELQGATVRCPRCTQPNIVPSGASASFYACSACGANLGVSQTSCPSCGRELMPSRGRLGGGSLALITVSLCLGIAFTSDRDVGPGALCAAMGFAAIVGLAAPKRTTWKCLFCRRSYPDTGAGRPGPATGGGFGCVAAIIIAVAIAFILFVASSMGRHGPW